MGKSLVALLLFAAVLTSAGCSALSVGSNPVNTSRTNESSSVNTVEISSESDESSEMSVPQKEQPSKPSFTETEEKPESSKEESSKAESSDLESFIQESLDIHIHSFGDYNITDEPDCIHDGKAVAECECGKSIEKVIPALGHEYVVDHSDWATIYYKCQRCGDEITEKKEIKKSKDINDLSVSVEEEHIYDGSLFRPTVTIYDGDEDITGSANIQYDNNAVQVGSYFLTIYMKGIYTGSRRYEYKIFPQSPELKLKKEGEDYYTVKWNNDGDMSGYVLEYSKKKDFSDATTIDLKGHRKSCKVTDVEEDTRYYFRIRAVKTVNNSVSYRSHWSNVLEVGTPHIEVRNGITYVDGILIANKTYSLPSDYDPGFDRETEKAFNKMAADALNDGLYLFIISGYRSYSTQYSTYNYFVWERGVVEADRASARPGHSEHQSGLAIDINTTSSAFEGTPEAIWLEKNCWKYGFIIRYPKGKEDITGYKYEPWHVRYLGKDIAKKVYDSGLTLEEYLGIDSVYSY